jgi:cytoskeletal protein CcmA (bactofilin family)
MRHRISWLGIILLAVFAIPFVASAATFQTGNSYTLPASETVNGNLYIGAGTITVAGTVNGDIVAGGGTVTVNGTINGDVLIGSGTMALNGAVNGDARVTGGNLSLTGTVSGDLTAAGGQVSIQSGGTVEGDLVAAGGTITVDGQISGDVRAATGDLRINGPVNGSVQAWVEDLTLGDQARITGDLVYRGPHELTKSSSAVVSGKIEYTKKAFGAKAKYLGAFGAGWMFNILATALAAIVLVLVLPGFSSAVVGRGVGSYGRELLVGFLILIVTPVAAALCLMSIIGALLGLFLLAVYGIALLMAGIYSGVLFGAWLFRLFKQSGIKPWLSALVGVVVLHIILFVPFLGWIVGCLFFLIALGSLLDQDWKMKRGLTVPPAQSS